MARTLENGPDRAKETVREIKDKFDLVTPDEGYKVLQTKRLERARARGLLEAREGLTDLVPGIDMDALDRCVGTDYIEQLNVIGNLRGGVLSLQRDFGKGLSSQGVDNLNRYLAQNMLDEVRQRVFEFQGLYWDIDKTGMPLDLREQVVPLALDFNHVKIMALLAPKGDYRVIVTNPSGKRILNKVYTPVS